MISFFLSLAYMLSTERKKEVPTDQSPSNGGISISSMHEVLSSVSRLENAFLDFRLRDFTDLKMQVNSAFSRMDLIEKRIENIEKQKSESRNGAQFWIQTLVGFFGGGLVVWLATMMIAKH